MNCPLTPEQVQITMGLIVANFANATLDFTAGRRGAIIGHLSSVWPDARLRRLCLGWLFTGKADQLHSRDLTAVQWLALSRWIAADQQEDGKWIPCQWFAQEAAAVGNLVNALDLQDAPTLPGLVQSAVEQGGVVTKTERRAYTFD